MCGIAGFFVPRTRVEDGPGRLRRMAGALNHRGPDDQGIWHDASTGIGLAHARLSVVDLSPQGHQPMHSASGRFSICFNGEIYNFSELRSQLESRGVRFRGHCDTEVLLEGIEHYGLSEMVSRCTGMFAFAIWDKHERSLSLVRDRLGIKPLYWSTSNERLVFGSELKGLLASGFVERRLDPEAVSAFLTLSYVPTPYSIFDGVHKLGPGEIAVVTESEGVLRTRTSRYWCSAQVALAAREAPFEGNDQSILDQLDSIIGRAVGDRMTADVPLGAFLSGGIDSSLVVAMMQERSSEPIKTFTIGFNEDLYDESKPAKAIADHLGTDHTELVVTSKDSLAVVPRIPELFDEPFADSSQIPTYLVSKLARSEVTVSLSGDGGDELFGGYNRYGAGLKVFEQASRIPAPFRRTLATGIEMFSRSSWDRMYGVSRGLSLGRLKKLRFGSALHKIAGAIRSDDKLDFYQRMISTWPNASGVYPKVSSRSWLDEEVFSQEISFVEKMLLADTRSYMLDDILTKVDRASMAVSLEARVPLLDHRIYEAAWRLPMSLRLHQNTTKVALRELLGRRMPRHLFERPKMGFGVPLAYWLRHELRDWAESLLQPCDLEHLGLDADLIRHEWERMRTMNVDVSPRIWSVLMLRSWFDRWGKP